ncbi:hypothetical protein [Streptomyces sp. NPDC020983]|uniref:WDGH domain-containing protein n=1 Tax=Streptomyces sp. NPDC020983 TaxID=3365106 RepID=UPI0037AB75A4
MAELSGDRREELCTWLRANGIDPNNVPLDADMTIESDATAQRWIRTEIYAINANGDRFMNAYGTNAARDRIMTPLKAEPPHWWEPREKPTRDQLQQQLTAVYRERAHLVAHLASLYPSTMVEDPQDIDWRIVYLDTPVGQWSWHISVDDIDLFAHVPAGAAEWDGHTTAEKYQRMRELTELRSGETPS